MWRDALQAIGRRQAAFLALSLVLVAYLSIREDTTNADLALGGSFVLALWVLTGIRACMKVGESRNATRGKPHAR